MTIDDQLAAIEPERRRALAETLADLRSRWGDIASWCRREGADAWCVLAAHCRTLAAAGHPALRSPVHDFVLALADHPASSWWWCEVVVSCAKDADAANVCELAELFTHDIGPAVRAQLAAKKPHRNSLFKALERRGALTIDDAVAGLADPALREHAKRFLRTRGREAEAQLRTSLTTASEDARIAIVRALRVIDPHTANDGGKPVGSTVELEAALREHPRDADTLQIWADLMIDRGDSRGQIASWMCAIAEAPPERALELSVQLADHMAQHRMSSLGKPGGFPFRDAFYGRTYIAFEATYYVVNRGRLRITGTPEAINARVATFCEQLTTLDRPFERGPNYRFALTWPGTKIRLPYQEPGHYPTGEAARLQSTLSISGPMLYLRLELPFETFDDPTFVRIYDAIVERLGPNVLVPECFATVTPTVDGKRTKVKRVPFER